MSEQKDDKDMSLAEREQWLRERGVLIESPEDRKSATNNNKGHFSILEQLAALNLSVPDEQDDRHHNDDDGSIQFVWVPQDDTRPLRTLQLPASIVKEKPGDALPNYVQKYFGSDAKTIDANLLKQQATKHFAGGQLEGLASTNISAAAMNAVAAQGSVETFPLVHPADTNDYTGVYIYLDEVGLLKKLPHNQRASQMAAACGYDPAPTFYGDVFIGRVQNKPVMKNVDFCAGVDTNRGAVWMTRAVSENLAWQQEMNRVTGKVGATQPAHVGTDGNVASEDAFTWTQEDDEIEITVPFVEILDKSKVKVSFLARSIQIKYDGKDHPGIGKVKLYSAVDVDGCTWTIDGQNLIITCEKANGGEIWPRIKESSS